MDVVCIFYHHDLIYWSRYVSIKSLQTPHLHSLCMIIQLKKHFLSNLMETFMLLTCNSEQISENTGD